MIGGTSADQSFCPANCSTNNLIVYFNFFNQKENIAIFTMAMFSYVIINATLFTTPTKYTSLLNTLQSRDGRLHDRGHFV